MGIGHNIYTCFAYIFYLFLVLWMLLKECLGYNVDWTQTPPLTPLQKKQQKEQAGAQTPTSTTSTHVKKKIDKNMIRRVDVSELFTNKGKEEEKEKDLEAGTASGSGSGSASIDDSPSSSSPTSPTPHIHINTGPTTTHKSKATVTRETNPVLPLFYTTSPPLEPETPETIYEAKPRHLYSPILYAPITPTVYSAITPTTPKATTTPTVTAPAATIITIDTAPTPSSPAGKASISITTTDMDVSLTSQAIEEGIYGPDDEFQCSYNYQQFQYQLQIPPIPIPVERATTTVVTTSPIDDNRFSFVQRISYVENKGFRFPTTPPSYISTPLPISNLSSNPPHDITLQLESPEFSNSPLSLSPSPHTTPITPTPLSPFPLPILSIGKRSGSNSGSRSGEGEGQGENEGEVDELNSSYSNSNSTSSHSHYSSHSNSNTSIQIYANPADDDIPIRLVKLPEWRWNSSSCSGRINWKMRVFGVDVFDDIENREDVVNDLEKGLGSDVDVGTGSGVGLGNKALGFRFWNHKSDEKELSKDGEDHDDADEDFFDMIIRMGLYDGAI